MAYIGKTPIVGNFQKCDALSASGTADYTLQVSSTNVVPESANHMLVSLNGILQAPTTSFTVSGSTLSFASALTSSDSIDFVMLLGNVLDIGTPSDATVTNAKLAQDIISGETALTTEPASTDELLVSDAGTLKRIDYKLIANTPSFMAYLNSNQTINDDTSTKIAINTELYDTDSTFDNSSNYRFTPAVVGKYFVSLTIGYYDNQNDVDRIIAMIYKNGVKVREHDQLGWTSTIRVGYIHCNTIFDMDADDYLEFYAHVNTTDSGTCEVIGGTTNKATLALAYKISGA